MKEFENKDTISMNQLLKKTNDLFASNYWSSEIGKARLIPLSKNGKQIVDKNNVRTISVLSAYTKLIERCIHVKMLEVMYGENGCIPMA